MLRRITLGLLLLGGILSAEPPLTFVTQSPLQPATTNLNYGTTITATGGSGAYTFTATGLPSWLTLGPQGNLSGVAPSPGPVTFTVTVTDTSSNSASEAFTLPVNRLLAIASSSPLQPATLGVAASYRLMATGGTGGYTWSSTCLPAWLSLDPSGTLSTNSNPPSAGTYTFALTVTDSADNTSSKLFTLVVESALTIVTPPAIPAATVGVPYSFKFIAAGGSGDFSEYSWSASGLPQGFALSQSGVLTGESATAGPISFVVTLTDPVSESQTQKSFVLAVNAQLTISFRAPIGVGSMRSGKELVLPTATDDELYTGSFLVSGGTGPFTWSATGLPSWFILAPTGFLTGTPPDGTTTASFTATVTDSTNRMASLTVTLSINPPLVGIIPVVSSNGPPTLLPEGAVGVPYSIYFCLPGSTGLSTWSASPPLPTWLTLPPGPSSTAQLSGTPPAPGSVTFTVTATPNPAQPVTSETFTLPIESAPVISNAPTPAIVGVPYTFQFTATGGSGTYSWSATGLPSWLALSASGVLMGTPPAAGPVSFTATVMDSLGASTTQSFTLQVNAALQISPTSLAAATAGMLYSVQFMGTGGTGTYTWTATGLPTWLNLSTSGLLMGTPSAPGTVTFSVTLTDSANDTITSSFMLVINPAQGNALAITTTSPLPTGIVGALYSLQFAATGGAGNYTWTATGLPTWLGLSTGGALLGTPPAAGTLTFTVTVTDSQKGTASSTFTLVVNPAQGAPLAITTTSPLPAATVGLLYSLQFAATGGTGPYTWTASGLPTWVSLSSGGSLTGTPPATGTITFTVTVTDSAQSTISTTFTLPVNPAQGAPLAISTTSPLPTATVDTFYSLQFAATGGTGPYTWTATGLPTWLALSSGGSLLGTPPAAGTLTFNVTVTDTAQNAASATFMLLVNPVTSTPLTITTSSLLPPATVGVLYSAQFAAAGGTGADTWTASGLPIWLTLSAGGLLTGTPPATGTLMFSVTVSDSSNDGASATFMLPVNPVTSTPLAITTTSPLPAATVGTLYSLQFGGSGGTGTYTWTATGLPAWLGLSAGGALMGTPPASGTTTFTVTVTDSAKNTATNMITLTVNPAQVTGPLTIITTSPLPSGTVGLLYSQQFAATGGTNSYLWTATGLPSWLTLSTGGLLIGTPSITSSLQFTVTVTDSSAHSASRTFALSIALPILQLAITTSSPLPDATKGVFYSNTLTAANGRGNYTWAAVGLPSGMTLSTAGILSGTPTSAGQFSVKITVTDDSQAMASKTFTLTVLSSGGPLQFASSALPACTVDSICRAIISATGGVPPYTFSLNQTTAIGDNLTLSPEGLISGLPAEAEVLSFSVQVTDSTRNAIFQTFRLQVNGTTLSITSATLPSGTVNTPYSATLAATGGSVYSWSIVSGSLPAGLMLNASSGAITGTPIAAGSSTFSAEAASGNLVSAPQSFTITITGTEQLTIISPLQLPPANLRASDNQNLSATGGSGGYTWTITAGSLPAGLTLAPSGAISGTPTTPQTAKFTATVTDSSGTTASAKFSLTVINPAVPSILTSSPLPDAVVNQPYNYPVSVTGGVAPYTWSITQGMIPDGLTFDSLTGTFSGTPTTTNSFTFTLTVLDSTSPQSLQTTQTYTIRVLAPTDFHITAASMLPNGTLNLAYQQSLAATGGTPPYTWQLVSGSWPAGISLDSTGNLSGTPTSSGTYAVVVQVIDSTGAVGTAAFSLTVANPRVPTVGTNPAPEPGILNTPYTHTFTAGGGTGPYTWTVVMGSLPPGLTLNPSTGVLSGTPTQKGNYPITVQVTDANGTVSTQQFTIDILSNDLSITPAALPVASLNVPYSYTLTAIGGTTPYTWSLTTGSLVAGFTLNPVTGVLSGTPTQAGTLNFNISVSDQSNDQNSQSFSLTVGATSMLTITTTQTKQTTMVGTPYSFTFAAAQGNAPYTWSVATGALPLGLNLNSKTGILAGTPTTAGTYSFTVQAADASGGTAQVAITIVVTPAALAISTGATLPAGVAGTAYSTRLQSTGGSGPITWSVGSGTPPGLSLASSTGVLSGTPTMAGDFKFTVKATDSTGAVVSQTVSLSIAAPAAVVAMAAGLPATVNPGDQPTVTLTLSPAYSLPITVTATLQLSPSLTGASDLLFSNGSTTMQFTIPANTTQSSFTFQAGTVAGTIQLSLAYEAAGVDVTPSPTPVLSTQIVAAAPAIKSVVATQTTSGIQVVIDGLSTTREMKSATFQFTPASGATLQTTSVTVDVSAMFAAWYQSPSSLPLGSQFSLTIPFTVNGNVNTIASVSVTLTNSVGTSASVSSTVP